MRPIVTDVAWSVCLLVTAVSCAKTDEPIETPFGTWTKDSRGPEETWVRTGSPDLPRKRSVFL